jgi:hypothetical protein
VIRKFNDRCNNSVTEKLTIEEDEINVKALGQMKRNEENS